MSGASRTGSIQVGNQTFTVTQTGAACGWSLNGTGEAISAAGAAAAPSGAPESVLASSSAFGCGAPSDSTNQPSIVTLLPLTGPAGDVYTQSYTVTPYNPVNLVPRYMQIDISGQIFTVKQYPW